MNPTPRNRKGFTLIELLTVIAIIGILAAVLFPGVQGVIKKAKQSAAATKLRNIGQAYITIHDGKKYIQNGTWTKPSTAPTANSGSFFASSTAELGAVLAINANLGAAEIWYVDADAANDNATFPKQVLSGTVGNETITTEFRTNNSTNGYFAWDSYSPSNKNLTEQIPLLWTRGLGTDGKWTTTNGVWGADGGHLAFGDAHVEWRGDTSSTANQFASKRTPGSQTSNWQEAVWSAATASNGKALTTTVGP